MFPRKTRLYNGQRGCTRVYITLDQLFSNNIYAGSTFSSTIYAGSTFKTLVQPRFPRNHCCHRYPRNHRTYVRGSLEKSSGAGVNKAKCQSDHRAREKMSQNFKVTIGPNDHRTASNGHFYPMIIVTPPTASNGHFCPMVSTIV